MQLQFSLQQIFGSVEKTPHYIRNAIYFLTSSLKLTSPTSIDQSRIQQPSLSLSPSGIFMSTCNVDVRWFPFDVQKCDLKFGSWTHNGWLLDLQMLAVDTSTYIPNGEWDLVGKLRRRGNTQTYIRVHRYTKPFA